MHETFLRLQFLDFFNTGHGVPFRMSWAMTLEWHGGKPRGLGKIERMPWRTRVIPVESKLRATSASWGAVLD